MTMSDLYFGTDLFSDFDRLQRQMASLFGGFTSSIRSGRFGAFPQINRSTSARPTTRLRSSRSRRVSIRQSSMYRLTRGC
jgi:hypothetical protein